MSYLPRFLKKRVEAILKNYTDVDLVIEGHFHQAKVVGKYISLPSQACQGKVAVVEEGEVVFKNALMVYITLFVVSFLAATLLPLRV